MSIFYCTICRNYSSCQTQIHFLRWRYIAEFSRHIFILPIFTVLSSSLIFIMFFSYVLYICSRYLPLIILNEINYNALIHPWLTSNWKQSQFFLDQWNKWLKLPIFKPNVWQPSTSRIFAEDFYFLIITHACPFLGEHRTRLLIDYFSWMIQLLNFQS